MIRGKGEGWAMALRLMDLSFSCFEARQARCDGHSEWCEAYETGRDR